MSEGDGGAESWKAHTEGADHLSYPISVRAWLLFFGWWMDVFAHGSPAHVGLIGGGARHTYT